MVDMRRRSPASVGPAPSQPLETETEPPRKPIGIEPLQPIPTCGSYHGCQCGRPMTDPTIGSPADVEGRALLIKKSVKTWTGELIDLGGRNTLLYYRDLKQGTLDLSPDSPAGDVAVDQLLAGRTTRLSNLFDGPSVATAARRARTIKAKAKENFEERGLLTTFLAWGMATWTTPKGAGLPAAPVLLRQAALAPRSGASEDFDLTLPGDWEINPTLIHLLRTEYSD